MAASRGIQDPLASALAATVRTLRRGQDPHRRTVRATQALLRMKDAELEISRLRDAAVVELSGRGYSCQDIGTVAGLTRGRVNQILHRARAADAGHPNNGRPEAGSGAAR